MHYRSRGVVQNSAIKRQASSLVVPVKRPMMLLVGVTCLVLALSLAPAVFAQTDTGSVRGTVTDEQDKAVTGVDVTMTNVDTAYSRSTKTDADGNYGFQSLPAGRYTLKVAGTQGFKTFEEKDIILHVNDNLTLDAKLVVGTATQTVEVIATPTRLS